MKIIDKNIADQTRGIFRAASVIPSQEGLSMAMGIQNPNEWRDIPPEKGSRQILSDEEILELSELVLKIERHYGFPCDIEWAREAGKFYIVQSRPITTLNRDRATQENDVFELEFTREIHPNTYYLWFRGYLKACRILSIDTRLPEKTFTVYDNGKVKCYTPQGNIQTMKDAANNLAVSDVEKIISEYLKGFNDVHNGTSLTDEQICDIVAGFVITFIVGDIQDHSLATQALNARMKTETLFTLLSRNIDTQPTQFPGRAILTKDQVLEIKNGSELEAFLNDTKVEVMEIEDVVSDTIDRDEFHGEAAQKGIVRARVRKIVRQEQIPDLQHGEVLVAEMTHPSFLPALKKASAIVTNEGGITCHAAIVSRELKKPCIIGTKIATQVLHDGDLVEVDADKGVVRVLERAGDA